MPSFIGHVEVHAHQHALAMEVDVTDGLLVHRVTPGSLTTTRGEAARYVSKPSNAAVGPSSSSIFIKRLYLAVRSPRVGAPVLICPVPIPTARSAIVVSSVSPERCDTIAVQPARRASRIAPSSP